MQRYIMFFIVACMLTTITGCAKAEKKIAEEQIRAVKTVNIESTENPIILEYIGTVAAKDIVNYSFKTGGKIQEIYVQEGSKVKPGDMLAKLDVQDLQFQVSAAKTSLDTISLNIKKAQDTLKYNQDLFDKISELYSAGAVSQDQYEQSKLQLDVSEANYQQAEFQYENMKVDYDYKRSLLEDAILYVDQQGTLLNVYYKENERIAPNMPLATVQGNEYIVKVGIPQQDVKKLATGLSAHIDVDGDVFKGVITNISEVPDQATRAYVVEISVNDKELQLGAIAKVSLAMGVQKGIWIPLTAVFSSGEDYVYIIYEDRAFKRTIEVLGIFENQLLVSGIKEGETLGIGGTKNLADGYRVKIVQ